MPQTRPIRILALDGGGIRGIVPAKVLEFIEFSTGKRIYELFDLVAGTSTGSLLACGLTKPNPKSAGEMRDLYQRRGPEIFSRSWTETIKKVGGLTGPKYGDAGISRVLLDEFGDVTLGECLIPTLVTAYEIQVRKPVFFSSYDTPANYIRDVTRASSAGPTFFPPARFGRPPMPMGAYIDGGTICNNPSIAALTEASKLFDVSKSSVIVLSLGTGSSEQPLDYDTAKNWGQLAWVRPLIGIFMDGVSSINAYVMSEILPPENYLRLQATLTGSLGDMDNVDPINMARLESIGQGLIDVNRQKLVALSERLIR